MVNEMRFSLKESAKETSTIAQTIESCSKESNSCVCQGMTMISGSRPNI